MPDDETQTDSSCPTAGAGNYVAQQGDCMESIALDHGFFWKTLRNLPENSDLKSARKDPNVLLPGDSVFIPKIRVNLVSGAAGTRHKFVRKGVPSKLRIEVKWGGLPLANQKYIIEIDGIASSGVTTGTGVVDVPIAPSAKRAVLKVGDDPALVTIYQFTLGGIDPIESISGIATRLLNLGFPASGGADSSEALKESLILFQDKYQLPTTGQLDDATRKKLLTEHRS